MINRKVRISILTGCLAMAGFSAGCDIPAPPAFRLNMQQLVSDGTPTEPEHQQAIADVLTAMFGTPDEPHALPETGLDIRKLRMAAGPAWSDEVGTSFGLYRKHCVHCHGISGDGNGPTARFLNPYPRDYRQGVYKFKSTYNPAKPTDEDLKRVMIHGVPGTSMPSFSLLPEMEIDALIEYVKYLSMRGQLELELAYYVADGLDDVDVLDEDGEPVLDEDGSPLTALAPLDPTNYPEQLEEIMEALERIVDQWNEANEQIIVPEEDQIPEDNRSPEEIMASIAKGRELFYGTRANCVECHGNTALGDGQQDDYDIWNKSLVQFLNVLAENPDDEFAPQRRAVANLTFPVRNAIPRNLREGVYRGGRRRIDVYWRIHAGIAGTPMPGSGPASPGAQGTITDEEIWNIVDYVLSLPYEAPSRPLEALPVNRELIN